MFANGKLNIKNIDHVGYVVRDLDKTTKYFWEVLGIGPWEFMEFGPNVEKYKYYGKEDKLLVKIAEARVGDVSIELIQPVSGPSPHRDFLEKHGEGMQHLGILVDSYQDVEEMKKLGYTVMIEGTGIGDSKDGFCYYLDTEKEIGCVIECCVYPSDPSSLHYYKIYPEPSEQK